MLKSNLNEKKKNLFKCAKSKVKNIENGFKNKKKNLYKISLLLLKDSFQEITK